MGVGVGILTRGSGEALNLVDGFWSIKVDELDLIQMKGEMSAKPCL